ncbi:MAG: MarR family transcriptional regulator [Proteobacteria bacterium]|nr:MarR family transcriptional regulator [Pseudomonadota bacterium]MCP4922356.1 MarR family transcriptional regulator [Pseudomonadota bacterium]
MSNKGLGPLEDALAYRLHRTARRLRVHLVRFLAQHAPGVSPEQYFLLYRLHREDGRALKELKDPALDDRANVTRLVAGLERQGLVGRDKDDDDARIVRVFLTESGRTLFDRLLPKVVALREEAFGQVEASDIEAFSRVLDHLEAEF